MRISLLTAGTRGDVEPMVALALVLAERGAEVSLAAPTDLRAFVEGFGVRYAPLRADFLTRAQTPEGIAALKGDPRAGLRLLREVRPAMRQVLDDARAAAEGADRIVFHPKALAGRHLAEAWGIPGWVFAAVPLVCPTRAFPAPATVPFDLGPLNRATYALASAAEGMFAREVTDWRSGLGLASKARRGVRMAGERRLPVLHAHSRHLVPRPDDWDADAHVTGFWTIPGEHLPPLAPELEDFLAAGEPPVVVGFGSMGVARADAVARLATEAVRRVGRRGVLVGLPEVPGEDVISVPGAPFGRLFPRCAATVHHGGAGTTGASLLAGRPTVVAPHGIDQPFWARRVEEAGAGVRVGLRGLSAERLAAALERVLRAEVVARAAGLGEAMRAERGAEAAAELILG